MLFYEIDYNAIFAEVFIIKNASCLLSFSFHGSNRLLLLLITTQEDNWPYMKLIESISYMLENLGRYHWQFVEYNHTVSGQILNDLWHIVCTYRIYE